jgi:antitoxin (DNA-binding transcriptional repressor) of toxin-antitoxin stability system
VSRQLHPNAVFVVEGQLRFRLVPLTDVASCSYIDAMKAVGVRELKNRLSEYLRLVRNGEEILVTDRGEVVAELRQPSPRVALPYPALLEVVRQGRARIGLPNRPDLYPALGPVVPRGSAAKLLDEERGER